MQKLTNLADNTTIDLETRYLLQAAKEFWFASIIGCDMSYTFFAYNHGQVAGILALAMHLEKADAGDSFSNRIAHSIIDQLSET